MSFEMILGSKVVTNPPEANSADDLKKVHNQQFIDNQIISNNVILDNWNKCKHKSEPMETQIPSCCAGSQTVVCINCLKLGTLQISPVICAHCTRAEYRVEESI